MADGFGASRYGLRPTAGPHRCLAAHVVNHKSSEASTTINSQLQAKRICARARSAEKFGTLNCDIVALARIRAPSASVCE